MKLLKCYVENFGKLSDFTYEFQDGINIINEKNGFGKTTFASFIKAMFYGLESTTKRTTALTDRKKYMPWQGGNFGGNIEFSINNKKYKIERFFGKKDSEDIFKLYDLNTNLESKDYTENIGEEIFKINREAYERSTYIPQQKLKIQMNDSINAKLGNILESENDVNTFEQAIKKLNDSIKKYKKTGNRGLIDLEKNNIEKIEKKIELAKLQEKNIEERRQKLKEIDLIIKEQETVKGSIQKNINNTIDWERKNAKKETYQTILKKYDDSKIKYDELEKFFKGEIPKDSEIEILIDKCLEIEKYKVEFSNYDLTEENKNILEKLSELFRNKSINEERINQKISDYNEIKEVQNRIDAAIINKEHNDKQVIDLNKKNRQNKNRLIILIVLTLIVAIVGIASTFVNKLLGIILIVLAVIIGIVLIINKSRSKKTELLYKEKQKECEEFDEVINNLEDKKKNLETGVSKFIKEFSDLDNDEENIIKLTEIKSNFNKYNDLNNNMNLILEKKTLTERKLLLLEESIKEYLMKYFDELNKSYTKLAEELKIKKQEFISLQEELNENLKEKEEYEKNNNIEELNNDSISSKELSKEELEANFRQVEEKINILNDEKNYIKNQIEKLEVDVEESDDLERDLLEKKELLEELEKKYNILNMTKNMLEKSKEQFSSHYLGDMTKGFEKYVKLINNENINMEIDINLEAKMEYKGSKKDIDFLSTGYKDLIYLCMRFSLIKALFKDQSPFVILDDPFVNLDEEKTKNAISLIKELAKEYQIIYFICHNSRG